MIYLPYAARNGVYANVVEKVREAFEAQEVLRFDCAHVGMSDCKRSAVKLRVCDFPEPLYVVEVTSWAGQETG